MFTITRQRSTHGARLERWLGPEAVAQMSKNMKGWYGPPIAVAGVPGNVWAHGDGDFHGIIRSGFALPAVEWGLGCLKRWLQETGRMNRGRMNAGFASWSDIYSAMSTAKQNQITFQKSGPTGVVNSCHSLWRVGSSPAAGGAGSAAPGGRACDNTTTGALLGLQNVSTQTRHFILGAPTASVAANSLMLYDRLFDVAKTINSSATESVTGVPTRYQSSTASNADYAGGNFIFMEVGATAYANTAHNWNVCQYRNQAGTDAQTMPSLAGNPGGVATIADRFDMPVGTWFAPLATGDFGAMDLAQMQCSAAVATGALNFVIGHPIALMPCPIANLVCFTDGVHTALNLVRVFDAACLALFEMPKPATTATNYAGTITFAHN